MKRLVEIACFLSALCVLLCRDHVSSALADTMILTQALVKQGGIAIATDADSSPIFASSYASTSNDTCDDGGSRCVTLGGNNVVVTSIFGSASAMGDSDGRVGASAYVLGSVKK